MVAKSLTMSSCVRTTCGMSTTWLPIATDAVATTAASTIVPTPTVTVSPSCAPGWRTVTYRLRGNAQRSTSAWRLA